MSNWWRRCALGAVLLAFGASLALGPAWPGSEGPSAVFGDDQRAVGADLVLRSLARREAVAESWVYEAVVANSGDQAASGFTVQIEGFGCATARGDAGVAWRDAQKVTTIAASGVYTATWQTQFGCQWARVVADSERDVPEADRGDNALEVWFRRDRQPVEVGTLGLTREGDPAAWRAPNGGRLQGAGFFGDFWFTSGNTSRTQAQNWGVWSVSVTPGAYQLFAYVPRHGDLNNQRKPDAPSAVYQVWDQTGRWRDAVTIDQERFADSWVPLGSYYLSWTSRVRLGDNVGASTPAGTWVLFDTIRAVPDF